MEGWPLLQGKHVTWIDRGRHVAALCCYLVMAVLSSVPGELRPHVPGFSDKLEHFAAFLVLGAVTVLSSSQAFSGRRLFAIVVAYAAVLEVGQYFIPGRVASLLDLAASSAGALVGVTLGLSVRRSPAMSPALRRSQSP